jgi:hypothetical protein
VSEWPTYYILIDRVPVAVDLMTWAHWFERGFEQRQIVRTEITDRCEVSTVFLGVDHNFRGGEPLLFETMTFGGPLGDDTRRYATLAEAERGHAEAVVQARKACAQIDTMLKRAGVDDGLA